MIFSLEVLGELFLLLMLARLLDKGIKCLIRAVTYLHFVFLS